MVIFLLIIATFFTSNVLRIILGLPSLLFFSGYTLIAALSLKRNPLDSIERVALSFGVSIAVASLIGLILKYTPWGGRLYPILIFVVVFIILTSLIAWYRRRRLPEADRPTPSFNLNLAPWKGQGFVEKVLIVILMVAILGAIGTLCYVTAAPETGVRSTEFLITGLEGKATHYPTELKVGEKGKVMVEVVNHEKAETRYRLEVRMEGVKNNKVAPIVLDDEQRWAETVSFTPSKAGDNQKVEFLLYKNEGSEAYLTLYLWINVKE